jgi:hypothetical protein
MTTPGIIPAAEVRSSLVTPTPGGIASRAGEDRRGNVTLFAFDQGRD